MSALENENMAIIRRWFDEVWNQRRLDTVDELLAPGAVAHDLGGLGASVCGPAAFRAAAEQLHQLFGEIHLTVEDIFAVEHTVAVRLSARLKNTGSLGDRPATGCEITVPIMCMVHLKNGKLIEGWNFWDIAAALRTAEAPLERTALF